MKSDSGDIRSLTRQLARSGSQCAAGIAGGRLFGTVVLIAMLIMTPGVAQRVWADDPSEALDRDLLDALEGKPAKNSPLEIIPRLIDDTRAAASRLQEGELGPDTRQLQTQILADLDALLEQAAPPSPPPQNGAASQDQQQQQQDAQGEQQKDESPQDSQPGQDDEGRSDDPSKESQERSAQGTQIDAERQRRLGLSTAAWGHLPPKVREQMRSAFSEEYLPQYDALVRQYYEALARRRAEQR